MATSGLDSVQANMILAASVGQGSFTAFSAGGTTTLGKLKFIVSGANENTDGTEITPGGGYTAGGPAITLATFWGSPAFASGVSSITNSGSTGSTSVTNMPAVASMAQAEIWDEASTPKRWWWGALTAAITTNSGDTVTFAASSITASLAI
jgi:hypothetical protein